MDALVSEKIDKFFSAFTPKIYKKGAVILRAGDTPMGAYYVKKGVVRQYVITSTGDMFIIHLYRRGSFFPLKWIVNDTSNTHYFEAVESTSIYRAPKNAMVSFLKMNPDVVYDTLQRILTGLSGLVTRTEHLVLDDAYTKTALLIQYLAKQFGDKKGSAVEITMHIVHREIAAWIGTTRETASLQIEALARKGFILQRGRKLIITNPEQLDNEIMRRKMV